METDLTYEALSNKVHEKWEWEKGALPSTGETLRAAIAKNPYMKVFVGQGYYDLVTPTHIEVIGEWVAAHLNRIRIVEAVHCDVPLDILLAVGRFDPANMVRQADDIKIEPLDSTHRHHSAGEMFKTWSYETDRPLSLERLREMVRRDLPASIYRCKGILYSVDSPEKRVTLQIVGRRTEISELDEWGERTPHMKIVAIGSADEIDMDTLTTLFESCIRESESAQ